MKKIIFLLALSFCFLGTTNLKKSKNHFPPDKGLYHLNLYSKNGAGFFHLTVYDKKTSNNIPALSDALLGYAPVTSTQTINFYDLPNDGANELTLTVTLFREGGNNAPTRGAWDIDFDISCIGKDLVERTVFPRQKITGKNYYDGLTKDAYGNDGFKIYLIRDFDATDCVNMLNKNTLEYNTFKANTGR